MSISDNSIGNEFFSYDGFIHLPSQVKNKDKVYAFDLDGTLICNSDGLDPRRSPVFSENYNFLGNVIEVITELSKSYTIFIVTNQLGFSETKKAMIYSVWKKLNKIPHVLISYKKDIYRKPQIGLFGVMKYIIFNSLSLNIDVNNSFYCGDAVGIHDTFEPYKWSSDDLYFSNNIGFNFIRPIDLFKSETIDINKNYNFIMMMGNQGSGKTSYAKWLELNYGYIRYSQDEIGDLKKQRDSMFKNLCEGKRIVLDATFALRENRNYFLQMIYSVQCRTCIVWSIRDGRPFDKLRPNSKSKFYHPRYTKSFNSPEEDNIGYDIVKIC